MNTSVFAIAVGIFLCVFAVGLVIRRAVGRVGVDYKQKAHIAGIAGQARWEKYGGVIWAVLVLVCGNQVFAQLQRGAPIKEIMFSFVATICAALAAGGTIGRLLLGQEQEFRSK